MLPVKRKEQIIRYLQANPVVSTAEIMEQIDASRSTVYRDLNQMRAEGLVHIQGSLVRLLQSEDAPRPAPFSQPSQGFGREQSESIAMQAVNMIGPMDSIFIGESSVCYQLAVKIKEQPQLKNITVVTNNFNAALELSTYIKHLYLIGGEVLMNAENLYTGGPKFASNLSTIFVGKAFASVDGVDTTVGYTMQELSQLNILSNLPSFASESIFLAPFSRFGYRSIHQLAALDFCNTIITDKNLPASFVEIFSALDKPTLVVAP